MKEKLWDTQDELGLEIGDMNGEWRKPQTGKTVEKPQRVPPVKKQECEKKHIRRTGKK